VKYQYGEFWMLTNHSCLIKKDAPQYRMRAKKNRPVKEGVEQSGVIAE